ncbi:MAG: hypothetical protein KOO63_03870 [Bacteroidales bacterium]|nr:hypothetical protein [Candidatus Latescibacterota bacterium]
MTLAVIFKIIKQKIGQSLAEIDGEQQEMLNSFLIHYIETANSLLAAYGITTGVTVDTDAVSLSADPADAIGLLLAYQCASSLIADDLVNRLKNGELGISFKTGASEITTNQAAITLKASAHRINRDYETLLVAYLSGDPNSVIERFQ